MDRNDELFLNPQGKGKRREKVIAGQKKKKKRTWGHTQTKPGRKGRATGSEARGPEDGRGTSYVKKMVTDLGCWKQ